MATRENLRNIDRTIQKNAAKTNKEAARRQVIKNIQNDIKYFLLDEFKQEMRINTSAYFIELQGIQKKQEIKETVFDSFEVNGTIKHKREISIYFDDNYLTLLNKAKKEVQAEELAELHKVQEAEAEQTQKIDNIYAIIKIILFILGLPIFFIGCLFYGIIKNCK